MRQSVVKKFGVGGTDFQVGGTHWWTHFQAMKSTRKEEQKPRTRKAFAEAADRGTNLQVHIGKR
jgi:hypothetical protein